MPSHLRQISTWVKTASNQLSVMKGNFKSSSHQEYDKSSHKEDFPCFLRMPPCWQRQRRISSGDSQWMMATLWTSSGCFGLCSEIRLFSCVSPHRPLGWPCSGRWVCRGLSCARLGGTATVGPCARAAQQTMHIFTQSHNAHLYTVTQCTSLHSKQCTSLHSHTMHIFTQQTMHIFTQSHKRRTSPHSIIDNLHVQVCAPQQLFFNKNKISLLLSVFNFIW